MAQTYVCGPVTTPGTPQKLVAVIAPALATISGMLSGSISPRGAFVQVQAHPSNTAGKNIFLGTRSDMSISGKSGEGMALLTGQQPQQLFADGGLIDLGEWYMDTDAVTGGTERLLVTVGP
jgi:hypothetical protein